MKYDIFISYSRHDSDAVNELVTLLEREGYSVWIDRDGIESGEDFKRVILKAIKESKVVLFFSSEHSNVSDWTAKEIGVAVKYKKHIIPIVLDDSNYNESVEFDLINLDYVDYSNVSTRMEKQGKLFKTLRNKLGQGSKELERIESERKAKEEEERARLEKERIAKAEAERRATEAAERERIERERKAEKERLEREAERKVKKDAQSLSDNSGTANGHEYVDLGLPSGTLWATCNLGASKPEDDGDYFAWGEIRPKTTYDWNTYKYANDHYEKLTKYCDNSIFGNAGFIDNLTELQTGDDPAASWGSGWRTPSWEQWNELLDNTTNQWTTQNGMCGRLFTSKKNGRTLFLPVAGYRNGSRLDGAGSYGIYWSSSLYTDSPYRAWLLSFSSGSSGYCYMYYYNRYYGLSVRAVRSARQN